jgi:DNA-binding FrmR family transcriptional regulator
MFPSEVERPSRALLGILLIEMGSITESQLRHALAEQEENGELLGEVLVANGYASRLAIKTALAKQRALGLEPEHEYGTGLLAKLADERSRAPLSASGLSHEARTKDPIASRSQADVSSGQVAQFEHRLEEHERRLEEVGGELDVLRDLLERASEAIVERKILSCVKDTVETDFLVVADRARRHLAARRAALPSLFQD